MLCDFYSTFFDKVSLVFRNPTPVRLSAITLQQEFLDPSTATPHSTPCFFAIMALNLLTHETVLANRTSRGSRHGRERELKMRDYAYLLEICASFRKEIRASLRTALAKSSAINEEQFLSEVLTGKCPRCGSDRTRNCEDMEPIGDFSVGLCVKCGYLWCSECGKPLRENTRCNHWDICGNCSTEHECDTVVSECKKLKDAWR
jgi:hypothetical protein